MLSAPIPDDEEQRLALLKACRILHTPAEAEFDDVARLAADLCGAEIALITLVDADTQWFKAKVGVDQTGTPRDMSFCGHCIAKPEPLVVEDTLLDARFADNPLVTGAPHLRFYAGVPLEVDAGSAVGALSVAGQSPRTLTAKQLGGLRRLARQVARELGLRRRLELAPPRASTTREPDDALPIGPGTIVGGRWRVARELGRGSAGAVFEAHDRAGERAAIKLLLPAWAAQERAVQRFAREARVLLHLETPHVCKLLDVGNLDATQGDLPFLVLEFLEGTDLERVLRERGPIGFREAFGWCADACDGIAAAHRLGVVHRDVKPSNVFLARGPGEPAGDGAVVKVLDFGIAAGDPSAADDVRLTGIDCTIGSLAYMSPEQLESSSDVDARSDVWSMGALLYELISGKLPFPGSTDLQMFTAALTRRPVPLSDEVLATLPPEAELVILTCLRKERSGRFPSMAALGRALREAAGAGVFPRPRA